MVSLVTYIYVPIMLKTYDGVCDTQINKKKLIDTSHRFFFNVFIIDSTLNYNLRFLQNREFHTISRSQNNIQSKLIPSIKKFNIKTYLYIQYTAFIIFFI